MAAEIFATLTRVKLTVKVMLRGHEDELRRLTVEFNKACNEVAKIAFETKTFAHRKLRALVYKDLVKRFCAGFSDSIAKRVATVYKKRGMRQKLVRFRSNASVALNQHLISYKRDGMASIRVVDKRVHVSYACRPGVELSHKCESTLLMDERGRFYIEQPINVHEPERQATESWLGVDLGVVNLATDSDGDIFTGKLVNGLRRRSVKLRARLSSKHTKSAKRLLKKRRRKEARFNRNTNHVISKKLVAKARDSRRGISLEDLKGIRSRIKVRRAQRGALHSWSFGQLRSFVEYKAKLAGVEVRLVDPRNTSRTCPECGHVDKKNRPSQAVFKCVRCGCAGHADHFAAREISRRAASFQPHAAPAVGAASQPHR